MEWIRETARGALLSVRAVPRAARNEIQGLHGGALKIRLNAPPVDGKANDALIRFLAETLDISRARISITAGETGRNKTVLIAGVTKQEVTGRLGRP